MRGRSPAMVAELPRPHRVPPMKKDPSQSRWIKSLLLNAERVCPYNVSYRMWSGGMNDGHRQARAWAAACGPSVQVDEIMLHARVTPEKFDALIDVLEAAP